MPSKPPPRRNAVANEAPDTLVREVFIAAPPETVYALLTTAEGLCQWMAAEATVEAHPDGLIRWRFENGDVVRGAFVVLEPHRRIEFTYGWEVGFAEIPPGSTTVTIDLTAKDDGTALRLTHAGLPTRAAAHDEGWQYFLGRLATTAGAPDAA
jgi:uncharacterized protein YndB with AHSA1/START domain